VNKITINLL